MPAVVLAAILVAGGWLRVAHHDWDQGQRQVPDEFFVTGVTLERTRIPPNVSLQTLLDPQNSPINTRAGGLAYPYGTLPVYLTRLVIEAASALLGDPYFTAHDGALQTGRVLAGLYDTFTALLVFAVAWRLWGTGAGLVAAALYAFAILPIHLSHQYISDPLMTMFMVAALLCSVLYYQVRGPWLVLLAGLCAGLAMACKVSAASALVLPVAAVALAGGGPGQRGWLRTLALATLGPLGALLGLLVGDPFAILDAPTYFAQLSHQVDIQRGAVDPWYTRRYVGTWPVLYQLGQLALLGAGPLVGVAGTLGIGAAAARAWRKRDRALLLLLAGAGAYFLSIVPSETKWVRYLLPLVPYICLFATALFVGTLERTGFSLGRNVGTLLPSGNRATHTIAGESTFQRSNVPTFQRLIAGVLVASAITGALAMNAVYGAEHTRVQASRWIYDNIPARATVGIEVNDGLMPLPLPGTPNPREHYSLIWMRLLADFSSEEAGSTLHEQLSQADYLIVSPVRPANTVRRLPWRYPVQIRYYDLLFDEQLGYQLVRKVASYPTVLGLCIPDDGAGVDPSFIEYDHPPIFIFKKERILSKAEWGELFAEAIAQPSVATRYAP